MGKNLGHKLTVSSKKMSQSQQRINHKRKITNKKT